MARGTESGWREQSWFTRSTATRGGPDSDPWMGLPSSSPISCSRTSRSTHPPEIDSDASLALGRWYEFGTGVLSRLVDAATDDAGATPPHLWPEHFDIAIELGSEAVGERANFGLSPGDENHVEPYLYVGPWSAEVSGELWQANGFSGAEMSYRDLVAAPDQGSAAMSFFETRRDALATIFGGS